MEIRRTEQRINTENGRVLIEKVTNVSLLNKKEVIDSTVITLPLHSYEKLVLEKNDRGTYTLTANLKAANKGLNPNAPIQVIAKNVMPYAIQAQLLQNRNGISYMILEPMSKSEESSSREEFEEMLLNSEG